MNINDIPYKERVSLEKFIATNFTKLIKEKEFEFIVYNYRGVVKIKNIIPPKNGLYGDYSVTIKVIKLQKEIFVDYVTKKKALKDITSVTSSNVRGVNNRIRYVIEKELQSFSGIFSIDRYRIKAKTVDYKTIKN